jgi:predicted ATPase
VGFLLSVQLITDRIERPDAYPFSLPAITSLKKRLVLDPRATILVGENGSGKSTLIEGIAVAAGFNAEGGSVNFRFSTRSSESPLHRSLRVARGEKRPKTGYFLRAESFYNVASHIEELDRIPTFSPPIIASYGGRSLHEQSHGESFLSLVRHRFSDGGLYLLDEPEAALSPMRQLALMSQLHRLVEKGSQLIIATHSPILMAFPGAAIYLLDETGIRITAYEDTEHYQVTRGFLEHRARYLKELLESEE